MNLITCTWHGTAAVGRAERTRIDCLKPVERNHCAKFIIDNGVNTSRFMRLYEVAKRPRFGQFEADFTQFGASEEERRRSTAPSIKGHFEDTRHLVDP